MRSIINKSLQLDFDFNILYFMFYSIPENVPLQLVYACLVMRMLYNIALDTYEKPNQNIVSFKSPSHKRQNIEVLFCFPTKLNNIL